MIAAGELVIVDLRGNGWREAHEGRTRPEQQYTHAWQLDPDHFALLFPPAVDGDSLDQERRRAA